MPQGAKAMPTATQRRVITREDVEDQSYANTRAMSGIRNAVTYPQLATGNASPIMGVVTANIQASSAQ